MRRRVVLTVLAALLSGAWLLQRRPAGSFPELPPPPPVPARALQSSGTQARIVMRDVKFRTTLLADVELPLLEITPHLPPLNRPVEEIRVDLIRLVGLRVISPIDTIHVPIDFFTPIPGPRIRVGRVSIEDAEIGEKAAPSNGFGEWFFHLRDFDLELRDIDIAGKRSTPERLKLTRLDVSGEAKGSPLQVTHANASVVRTRALFDLRLAAGLGKTSLAVHSRFKPNHDWALDLRADTVAFADLRVVNSSLPRDGTGKLDMSASHTGDDFGFHFRQASVLVGESRVNVRGSAATGPSPTADGLVIELHNVRPEDVKRALDLDLPAPGPFNGRITANGAADTGVRVAGSITGGPADAPARLAVNGSIRGEHHPVMDLELTGNPLRIADTTLTFVLRARGPLDTLRIRGDVALAQNLRGTTVALGAQPAPPLNLQSAAATIDAELINPAGAPPRLTGRAVLRGHANTDDGDGPAVHAMAEGSITFAAKPTVSARLTADSLPLTLLPWPAAIDSVRGSAQADVKVSGTLEDPQLAGALRLRAGAFRVASANLALTDINGPLRLQQDRVFVDTIRARARNGDLQVYGAATLLGDYKSVDLTLHAQNLQVTSGEPLYLANSTITVSGPLDAARAAGSAKVLDAATRVVRGTATGSAILARGGALQVDVLADSLPVESFPLPADQVDQLQGFMRGQLAVRGTVDDPSVNGTVRLFDAAARIRASGTKLTDVSGEVSIDERAARTSGIRGRAGQGTVVLSGSAGLRGEQRLDLTLRADSALIADMDSAHVVASGQVNVTGARALPHVSGRARLIDGWVREDMMKKNPVIDPERPPYAAQAARVPWIDARESRLLSASAQRKSRPSFVGQIALEVTPGIKLVDEDSELYGIGQITIAADSAGIRPIHSVRFLGGHYNNFGERFLVRGGGFRMTASGESRLALRGEHAIDKIGGSDFGSSSPLDWYPNIEIFAIGTTATAVQRLRRFTPLQESQTELGAALIYGEPIEPINGLYNPRFWLPDERSDFIGERTEQQGGALLWSYVADEAYDYLPLSRAALRGGSITMGSRYPGRIIQGPLFRFALNVTPDLDLSASLAPEGSAAPGLRARWRRGSFAVIGFTEPKFYSSSPSGQAFPGYFFRRRTGVGLRWDREF